MAEGVEELQDPTSGVLEALAPQAVAASGADDGTEAASAAETAQQVAVDGATACVGTAFRRF